MNKKLLLNTLCHQIIWWSSVLGAIYSIPYLGALAMIPVIAFHLLYMSTMKNEFVLIVIVAILGTFLDTLFNIFGVIDYSGTYNFAEWLAPIWITSMWVSFATTLNYSLKKLGTKKYLGVGLGAIFGPLAYFAGERYGAIDLMRPRLISLVILSISWGGIIPLLFKISDQIKKENRDETKAVILPIIRRFRPSK